MRSVFIVAGMGIGFGFYFTKDFIDGTFVAMKGNAIFSFIVRGGLAFLAGLVLFFALFFFEAIFLASNRSVEENLNEAEEPKRRTRIKQKTIRR